MNKSDQINELAAALAKAQGEIKAPEKNKTVTIHPRDGKPGYSFDYADLNKVIDAIREPLSKNNIAFTHLIEEDEKGLSLVTMLIHSSGQWISTRYPLPSNVETKALGASLTYGKRYCLSALVGVAADEDKDAEPENGAVVTERTNASVAARATQQLQQQRSAAPQRAATNQIRNVTQVGATTKR